MNDEITAAVKTAEKTLEKMTRGSTIHPIQIHQLHLTQQGGGLNVSQKKKKKIRCNSTPYLTGAT